MSPPLVSAYAPIITSAMGLAVGAVGHLLAATDPDPVHGEKSDANIQQRGKVVTESGQGRRRKYGSAAAELPEDRVIRRRPSKLNFYAARLAGGFL